MEVKDFSKLAKLIRERNANEVEISGIIPRSAYFVFF